MFYLKDSISIDNETVLFEASWLNPKLGNQDVINLVNNNHEKISQIYKEVVTTITEKLHDGSDSRDCVGSYCGDENIYSSEGGLVLSLSSFISNEDGWIKLNYPSTIVLDYDCHTSCSFLLKDANNHYFEVTYYYEENIPEYLNILLNDAVHTYENQYISTFSKTGTLHIPFTDINVAYAGYVEYEEDMTYTVESCMNSFGLTEEEAQEFVKQQNMQCKCSSSEKFFV